MIRQFSKDRVQMANENIKNVQHFLAIRKMQIKATVRLHVISFRMAVIKKINNDGETEKKENPYILLLGI